MGPEEHKVVTASANGTEHGGGQEGHGGGGGHGAGVVKPHFYLSGLFWVMVAAVVLILAANHLATVISHRLRVRRLSTPQEKTTRSGHTAIPTEDPDASEDDPTSPLASSDTTLVEEHLPKGYGPGVERAGTFRLRAWQTAQRNWLYLRTFPGWLYGPDTVADALWTIAYTCVFLVFVAISVVNTRECAVVSRSEPSRG